MSRSSTFPVDDAGELLVDVGKLVESRMLIQAMSGGGKSRTVRRVLEQTHGHVQQLVIDPEGEFSSLRERFDYVYAAPSGGDTVAHPRTAALLAERLLELGVSAILDLYELPAKPPRNDRVLFVRRFLEALVDAPKRLWHPVLVLVDEAHIFCPQKGNAESAGAVIDLCSRGRKRGFCAVLATQRLAKLHKDAAAELQNKLIGGASLDVDVDRSAEELGFPKARKREIIDLEPGHFFATGRAFSVRGVVEVHVGGVKTTHPEAGARIATTPPPATSKIRALLPKLADLPAEAEDRARTMEELRGDVKRLERELAAAKKAQPPAPPAPKPERVEVPVLSPAERVDLAATVATLRTVAGGLEAHAKAMTSVLDRVQRASKLPLVSRADGLYRGERREATRVTTLPKTPLASRPPPAPREPREDAAFGRGERAVLTAIAQHGDAGVTREQLTVLTGYKKSTRDLYLQKLRAAGLTDQVNDTLTATDAGVAELGADFEPLPTGDALREHWLARLPAGERAVLKAALSMHPGEVTREQISEATGYRKSTRDLYIQKLAARKLVTTTRGGVRAGDLLFDGGGR